MKIRYLLDTFRTKLANADSLGWPVRVIAGTLLMFYLSAFTDLFNWFWEIIVGGIKL